VSEVPTVDELAMVKAIVPVVKERLKVLEDVVEMSRFLFTEIDVPQSSSLIPKKQDAKTTLEVLKQVVPIIKKMANTADEVIEEELVALANGLEIKVNGVFMPIRVAVTGSTISPPLFDSIRLLGLDTAVARLERAISTLENEVA
jgi:glutamyl-tRNA synthetase